MSNGTNRKIAGNKPVIDHFREIDLQSPAEIIIQQIKELFSTGVLSPGDRLPPERALAERFGVGRGHIREAIKRLEFYGILKTLPQSGTIVASLGVKALEGLISNVLGLDRNDLESLLEIRFILEIHATKLAATRASEKEIAELRQSHEEFCHQVEGGSFALEEDLLFHLKIAECSHNTVLRSLLGLITPDVITLLRKRGTCRDGRSHVALTEHANIMDAIAARDPTAAATAMQAHMQRSMAQCEIDPPQPVKKRRRSAQKVLEVGRIRKDH
jgi:GntR family transcriptional repressor for pyruvate dehydrogenase complex